MHEGINFLIYRFLCLLQNQILHCSKIKHYEEEEITSISTKKNYNMWFP